MSWYANEVCMHVMKNMKWHVVHKKVRPIIIYYQSMHDKTLKKNERNENTYLIPIYFFANFLVESHYLDYPLFNLFFFIIFNMVFFFDKTFLSHTCQFLPFFIQHSKVFFEGKRIRHSLFNFSTFIQNKISSYFEK